MSPKHAGDAIRADRVPPSGGQPAPTSAGEEAPAPARPACPVCGGHLAEVRAKLQCERCHTICETCCEGGPG